MRSEFVGCLALLLLLWSTSTALSVQRYSWVNQYSGNWENGTNWSLGTQPTTIADVVIDVGSKVVVTLSSSRSIDGLYINLGNDLVLNSGVQLVITPGQNCPAGSYVNPPTQVCASCPSQSYQPNADESFCTACSLSNQVANANQTGCQYCSAGTYFSEGSCVNCSAGQTSNGNGGSCTCCAANYESVSGGLCVPCPSGQVSLSCGSCVSCLPVAQYTGCPISIYDGVQCGSVDNTCKLISVDGVSRGVCDCPLDSFFSFSPACDVVIFDVLTFPYNDNSAIIPSEFLVFTDVTSGSQVAEVTVSALGLYYTSFVDYSESLVYSSITTLELGDLPDGLVDPNATAPAGYTPTIFGFYVISWTESNDVTILQTSTPAFSVFVPFDFLVIEPSNLQLFYYNIELDSWVAASFSCSVQYNTTIYADQGVVEFPSLQATGEFWVFRKTVVLPPNPIHGGFNPGGTARVQTSTTQVTGIIPQPAPPNAPVAPVSQPQIFGAAASLTPSMLLLFVLAIVLFVF